MLNAGTSPYGPRSYLGFAYLLRWVLLCTTQQKVSTATATSHHIACTSEIHNTSEVNFAQRPVMLTFVHLRAVARSPWYQGQSWNCFLGILHNVYFSSFCPFSAFSDADLQLQGKERAL